MKLSTIVCKKVITVMNNDVYSAGCLNCLQKLKLFTSLSSFCLAWPLCNEYITNASSHKNGFQIFHLIFVVFSMWNESKIQTFCYVLLKYGILCVWYRLYQLLSLTSKTIQWVNCYLQNDTLKLATISNSRNLPLAELLIWSAWIHIDTTAYVFGNCQMYSHRTV